MKRITLLLSIVGVLVLTGTPAVTSGMQTDWYSRGIIRRQTIVGMNARNRKRQYEKKNRQKTRQRSTVVRRNSRAAVAARHTP